MKRFTTLCLAGLCLAGTCLASTVAADPVGLRLTKIEMPHHEARSGISIWYPNGGGGDQTVFGENPVFQGVDAAIWADIAAGEHPVVLLSHGMGGGFRTMSWLAAGLAENGAIVVGVNHPNSTWSDFDMQAGVQHWTRVQDLATALDSLLADPDFAGRVDTSRIMAAGFSFGGWTALSMGGARGNHAGTVATCETFGAEMSACDMLLSPQVNMQGVDPDLWNQSYADDRITHVAAIEPGLVWGLQADSVQGLDANTMMIGLGNPSGRMSATDFDASGLAALMPDAQIERLAPGFHFTAMPLCKPQGAAILAAEKDDPVCTDPDGTDRAKTHETIINLMADQLGL